MELDESKVQILSSDPDLSSVLKVLHLCRGTLHICSSRGVKADLFPASCQASGPLLRNLSSSVSVGRFLCISTSQGSWELIVPIQMAGIPALLPAV